MAVSRSNIEFCKSYYGIPKKTIFELAKYSLIPKCYHKFYYEWKETEKIPVHYIPKEGKYELDPETGLPREIQNTPIPAFIPEELNDTLLGGELVVRGRKEKQNKFKNIRPFFWIPKLLDSVVYSEVLNKHMKVVCTPNAIRMINKHFGLDNYLLQTRACDINTTLGLRLKQKILKALLEKDLYPDDENKREDVYNRYKHYLDAYTPDEIEWYGLTLEEAVIKSKLLMRNKVENSIVPLKHQYRKEFIENLKNIKEDDLVLESEKSWWRNKLRSFGKKLR